MLTIPFSQLPVHQSADVWVVEIDTEYGNVQTFGRSQVTAWGPPQGPAIESASTGGFYQEPSTHEGVELWNAEEHYLAVFADEQSMREGARAICARFGDQMPVGIYRQLAGA